ncbi:MAG: M3 family metallopeptidase [Bacteroidales bacterium]
MKKLTYLLIGFIMVLSACKTEEKGKHDNPLLAEFDTPFNAPPFDKIKEKHFKPAIEAAIEEHNQELAAITKNSDAPDFKNTIVAYDDAGKTLRRVTAIFSGLRSAETSDTLQEIAREVTPMLSRHQNSIYFNMDLFNKIKSVYEQREALDLEREDLRLVEKVYEDFERKGVALPEGERERLKEINERMDMVSLELRDNLLAENNNFKLVLESKEELEGLPEHVIEAAADQAENEGKEGKYVFTLSKPSWIPFVTYSERRNLREKIFKAYINRGDNDNEHDNKELFKELLTLRQEMSRMLGFDNYARYFTDIQMAKTPENVYDFLNEVWDPSLNRAREERDEMQALIDEREEDYDLEAWDWWYYSELIRKDKYDLDEDELKPYFTFDNVTEGIFLLANKLYGLTFEPRPEVPVYHKEVKAYEVFDHDNSHLGILYIDPHPRPSKRSGAWCGTYRPGHYENGEKISPLVTIVMNFTRPSGDNPAMLSWDETTTYFHEFGHALHNFFADGKYNRTSRSVPRDFVELPSQILENYAAEKELLKEYAIHHETNEPIPDKLVEKIEKSGHFNQGFIQTEYLAAAFLDMDWHTAEITPDIDVNEFEEKVMDRIGLIDEIIPRYRTTNFQHIFGSGYAAGYYVYRWAAVLDADAYAAFKETENIFNPELAQKFRKYIMAKNGIYEGMEAYKKFRGEEPTIEPFLKRTGLKE